MDDYSDIINLSRPVSKRPRMSLEQRSAQFAPFAALTGYEGQVKETARLTNKKIEINEELKEILNSYGLLNNIYFLLHSALSILDNNGCFSLMGNSSYSLMGFCHNILILD